MFNNHEVEYTNDEDYDDGYEQPDLDKDLKLVSQNFFNIADNLTVSLNAIPDWVNDEKNKTKLFVKEIKSIKQHVKDQIAMIRENANEITNVRQRISESEYDNVI